MNNLATIAVILYSVVLVTIVVGPPVNVKQDENNGTQKADTKQGEELLLGLSYNKYLQEIIGALEEDESFRSQLMSANASDIKSGDVAKHLELVSHGVRTRLDELKRQEIGRIRDLVREQQKQQVIKSDEAEKLVAHLDIRNQRTFEVADLAKLIRQASQDLEDLDKKRREEFKEYEMEKEHEKREKLRTLDEAHRKEEEKKQEELEKKHDNHPKVHHPGSRDQLEEVWEDSDNLNKEDFDPKTFFHLHDINGDGFLDQQEIEALFKQELDKVYDPNAPEDDMVERYEEMNRMREHVMKEVDQNKDQMISLAEFMDSTKNEEFNKDPGWDTIDDDREFTEEELAEYERQLREREQQEQLQGHAQPGEINIPPNPHQDVVKMNIPQQHVNEPNHVPVQEHHQGANDNQGQH